jgi:hypothetical protein
MRTRNEARRARARRCGLGSVAALSAALLGAGSAQAAFGLHDLAAAPADVTAGAHSNFSVHVGFSDSVDQVKNLTIHLPPGMIGNPTAPAVCTPAKLGKDDCPANSRVGTVSTATTVWVLKPLVGVPLTVDGTIYNLEPQSGEPARFGIVLRPPLSSLGVLPKITLQSAVELRQSDFGLDTVLKDIPNSVTGLAVDIQAMDITLLASAGDGPFMRNPTSCATATTKFDATSYVEPDQTVGGEASFTPTGCESLPFSPRLSASIGSPDHTANGTKPPLTTVIEQSDGEAGLRDATVILPAGIGPNNDALAVTCTADQFLAEGCPPGTILGSATARSPLLTQPLDGVVALVAPPAAGQLPVLGLDLHGQLNLKLFGTFVVTASGPGNAFVGLPDIPISRFALSFDPDHLIASTRDLCKGAKPVFHADFTAQSGTQRSTDEAARVNGCGGSTPGSRGRPRAQVRLSGTGSAQPRLRLVARAGVAKLRNVRLKLPAGLRFAGGQSWRSGVSASGGGHALPRGAVGHSRRALSVKARGRGADSLVVSVGEGALRIVGPLPRGKLRFPIVVRDTGGKTTRLVARARPR